MYLSCPAIDGVFMGGRESKSAELSVVPKKNPEFSLSAAFDSIYRFDSFVCGRLRKLKVPLSLSCQNTTDARDDD